MKKGALRKALNPLVTQQWKYDHPIDSALAECGDKALPKLKRLLKEGGTKNFVALCEELGALGEAAVHGAKRVVDFLLATGVSVSAATQMDGDALHRVVQEARNREKISRKGLDMVRLLLAAGAGLDTQPSSGARIEATPLYLALLAGLNDLYELLLPAASNAAKARTVVSAILASSDPPSARILARVLETLPLDGVGDKGMTALHAAAATGLPSVWEQVSARVKGDVNATLGEAATFYQSGFPSPIGGGVVTVTRFPEGSTPLDVLRSIRSIFTRGCSTYEIAPELSRYHQLSLESYRKMVKSTHELEAVMLGQGAVSKAQPAEFKGAHAAVMREFLRLGEAAGVREEVVFAASTIDMEGVGPLGLTLELVHYCRHQLAPAIVCDNHPLASLLRGTYSQRKVVYRNGAKSSDKQFAADPKTYPPESARVLNTVIIGLHGDMILAATREPAGTEMWTVTPSALTSAGNVATFVRQGVSILLGADPAQMPEPEPEPESESAQPSWIVGKHVCVSGKMKIKRAVAFESLVALGAVITKSITKKTELLFAGDRAGSKLIAAQKQGILVLDEVALTQTLEGNLPSSLRAPPPQETSAREPDALDALKERAAKSGAGEVIYAFRPLDAAPGTLNRRGGLPPGITEDTWPTEDDEPLVHLFTLDLDTMPELQGRCGGMRTCSVFINNPDSNEAWEPHNSHTEIVFRDHLGAAKPSRAPKGAMVREESGFEPVRIELSATVWSETESELYKSVYNLDARALGQPQWLQDEQYGGEFILQFDESFVDVNLGDSGVMYTFSDTAFWQCH